MLDARGSGGPIRMSDRKRSRRDKRGKIPPMTNCSSNTRLKLLAAGVSIYDED